jgi:glycine cleavage system H protein
MSDDLSIPRHLRYTEEHEWAFLEDNVVTIGLTDYAQDSLGELVYIELPEIGREVSKGDEIAVVESCKAASDVYAPISGKIVEVNDMLTDNPNMVNESPYEEGWLVKIEATENEEVEELLSASAYKAHTQ